MLYRLDFNDAAEASGMTIACHEMRPAFCRYEFVWFDLSGNVERLLVFVLYIREPCFPSSLP